MTTSAPSPASCLMINTGNCSDPVPGTAMCLTVNNQAQEDITLLQQVSGTVQPMCFQVAQGKTVSSQVPRNSAWTVIGNSGKVYYDSLSPQVAQYTVVITDYSPPPSLPGNRKGVSTMSFVILGGLILLVGCLGYFIIKKGLKRPPGFDTCLKVSSMSTCNTLYPLPQAPTAILVISIALAVLVALAYLILRGPLGQLLAQEPKQSATFQECTSRGSLWYYAMPSASDGVSGWRLKLRQLRCQAGGDSGPCSCVSPEMTHKCIQTAFSPGAPPGLAWQYLKANQYTAPSPASSPSTVPTGDVCACCTNASSTVDQQCFDVLEPDPLSHPCAGP